ncbi:MAG: glycoside hydrolase family 3 N-terminal domain-containing protein [Vicingaceae bacterium]
MRYILFLFVVLIVNSAWKPKLIAQDNDPPFLQQSTPWADSLIKTMTLDEKIGQLFMVAAYSNKDKNHEKSIEHLINKYHIGGLIFFQGGPVRQANLTNHYQSLSKIPLFIAIDGEWGLAMRLDSTIRYPYQMTLGAIQDNHLIYKMGEQIAEQCKRLGIHINFAPVVDVNVNPKNPIINARSFGEIKEQVAEKGKAYMLGMQHHRVMANAKHFPGHGDTDKDSHKTLPVILHSKQRIDSVELYPFKALINSGLASVMVAHLYIPALVNELNTATTLSKEVVTGLLKDSLGFKGLAFTDALNMKGVSAYYKSGVVDVKALKAGNDVLLFPEDIPAAFLEIKKALKNGELTEKEIEDHCLKILRAKEWCGVHNYKNISVDNLYIDLNKPQYEALNKQLFENALTLISNKDNILPFQDLKKLNAASLSIGADTITKFQQTIDLYKEIKHYNISDETSINIDDWVNKLEDYETIIIGIHKSDESPWKSYKINNKVDDLIATLSKSKKVITVLFANPYAMEYIPKVVNSKSLVVAYQNHFYAQFAAAQALFGAIAFKGKIPVSSLTFKAGTGLETKVVNRLKYGFPEEEGINSNDLNQIDSIALKGIKEGAYPGCQVLVAKNGKVIYKKNFGFYTYEKQQQVTDYSIYDLASITKVAATTASIMRLVDEGKINIDYNLCDYLPEWISDTSDFYNTNLREMLAHQAGLPAWIPFYLITIKKGILSYEIYSLDSSAVYSHRVAENLWINKAYKDTIFKIILRQKLKEKEYRYSDLGYYFFQRIIEKITQIPLNEYVDSVFYSSIGMATTTFLPRYKFSLNRIVPTENDTYFRKQIIRGDVHDPGAAMMGGVGGHAGLFSNANDLAKMMQMFLNGGTYGGIRYISDSTLKEFTRCQFCTESRRGAGFDKPARDGNGGPTCNCVSLESFGHTGFTGTLAWADPEYNIVYIFLSNRTYPDAENKKLLELNIRTDIQEVIYNAVIKSMQKSVDLPENP